MTGLFTGQKSPPRHSGARVSASPESIAQRSLRPDGFSDAQLRIIARAKGGAPRNDGGGNRSLHGAQRNAGGRGRESRIALSAPSGLRGRAYCVLATLGGWAEVMKLVASSIAGPKGVGTFSQNGTRIRVPATGANAISMLRWAARYLITGRSGM
ncbi:hypothetical protein ACVWXO_002007 [Bradyrhizobium sp. LM2.7]